MNSPSLPPKFLSRLESIVPSEALASVVQSFSAHKPTTFRVNSLLPGDLQDTSTEAAACRQSNLLAEIDIPIKPVDGIPDAFMVEPEYRAILTHLRLVDEGHLYIQGLSSMLASLVLGPRPNECVLDLAAAPGGKAIHLAALMKNQGRLSVVEPVRKRMFVLADNLKRYGVTIAKTYLMDGRNVGDKTPNRFDRIMLDAPCSSESRFRAGDPGSWQFWSERKIREQSRKQRGLIKSAFRALRPGGILLYATCSFAPEENELIVARLLKKFPGNAELLPIDLGIENWQPGLMQFADQHWPDEVLSCRRILPTKIMDGFFMARITKNMETPHPVRRRQRRR